jgi:hypothetical protein
VKVKNALWHARAPSMFLVSSGLFPRSSKRIITAGLQLTSNTAYHRHDHQHNTF